MRAPDTHSGGSTTEKKGTGGNIRHAPLRSCAGSAFASEAEGLLTLFVACWGEGKPLALLSMPVRLLRRLTGTALRAAFRSPPARERVSLPPKPPIPSPARFYREKSRGHKAALSQR